MSRNLPQFTLRAAVRAALASAGDKGATLADIEAATGADRAAIQRALGALGETGEKFAAPINGKLWRHFATETQRDAWVSGVPAPAAQPVEAPKPASYTAGPSKTAPRTSGEVRGMDTAPRIVAKTPAGRFDPDPGYVGPFSLAGIGRDVQTGKAWGAQA